MSDKILISLSNPISPDRDAEFNEWFNNVHGAEVTSLKGFRNMTRYRAVAQVVPPAEQPSYRYLAFYELDDVADAVESLTEGAKNFDMTDALDFSSATGIAFEKIFTTKK